PSRLAWADGALWVADLGSPGVWEIRRDEETVVHHPTPWPVTDVAPMIGAERLLYVTPSTGREVAILDLDTGALRAINPLVPDSPAMSFTSPVRGIEAIPLPYRFPEVDGDGVHRRGRSVAVSLFDGRIVF